MGVDITQPPTGIDVAARAPVRGSVLPQRKLAGAAAIATGIVLAFALLRPRTPRPEPQLAEAPAERAPVRARLALEEVA
jgi:predicted membrane-bound mannosyltransferase